MPYRIMTINVKRNCRKLYKYSRIYYYYNYFNPRMSVELMSLYESVCRVGSSYSALKCVKCAILYFYHDDVRYWYWYKVSVVSLFCTLTVMNASEYCYMTYSEHVVSRNSDIAINWSDCSDIAIFPIQPV